MVTVEFAISATLGDAEITDGLDEMLNQHLLDTKMDPFIVDWMFPKNPHGYKVKRTNKDIVEQGELFH